jgi:hypothetical protein
MYKGSFLISGSERFSEIDRKCRRIGALPSGSNKAESLQIQLMAVCKFIVKRSDL